MLKTQFGLWMEREFAAQEFELRCLQDERADQMTEEDVEDREEKTAAEVAVDDTGTINTNTSTTTSHLYRFCNALLANFSLDSRCDILSFCFPHESTLPHRDRETNAPKWNETVRPVSRAALHQEASHSISILKDFDRVSLLQSPTSTNGHQIDFVYRKSSHLLLLRYDQSVATRKALTYNSTTHRALDLSHHFNCYLTITTNLPSYHHRRCETCFTC